MDAGSAKFSGDGPAEVYSRRLQELERIQIAEQRRERLLGFAKLALVAVTLISAVFLLSRPGLIEFLVVPAGAFVLLAVLHEKLIRSLRLRARSIQFYERGLARLDDRWAGTGETGERFRDSSHPYARDLDLFGKASLFELLCTVRTRAGEETLAQWLLAAAPVEEVLLRQNAIRDLRDRVTFRENLFLPGDTVRLSVQPEALAAWGEQKPAFTKQATRIATTVLAILWILSLAGWGVWGLGAAAGAMTILNLAWAHWLHGRLDSAADAVEKATGGLERLASVLSLVEREKFSAPKLTGIQTSLKQNGALAVMAIHKLVRIAEYLHHRRNMIFQLLNLFIFCDAQLVFAAERWQKEFGSEIRGWLKAAGEVEALTALAAYAYEHPQDAFPEFAGPGSAPLFEAEGLAHPLLPVGKAVRNDFILGGGLQLIILSGPNMAGKSTFIRSVGMNAVLAQCGAPVRATRLRLSPLAVTASICVLDSLSGGVSRFYAEIHRIKLISDLAQGPVPVLFLLDELLSGTNSRDRLAGTELIVQNLMEQNAIGMVSTHDLALAAIPEAMSERAANCHFDDRFEGGQLIFDYKLKPGVVKTSNALELMRSIGLGAKQVVHI